MQLEVTKDHESVSRRAEQYLRRALRRKPGLLLGAATGDTPSRTYARLAARRASSPALFGRLRVVQLDEWLGLPADHPASCRRYLHERLLGPLQIPPRRFKGFDLRRDPLAECARHTRWLDRHGPIDVCLLGLGRNGHLLMIEPAASLVPLAHVARLHASTSRHPTLRRAGVRPRRGLTLGLAEILASRAVLLLVSGRHKRAPLRRMLRQRVDARCPASFLWLHPDVTVVCDRAAAGGLGRRRGA